MPCMVLVSSSAIAELRDATEEVRKMLLRRLCGKLQRAHLAANDDSVVIIGAGSEYTEIGSRLDAEIEYLKDDLEGRELKDPLLLAAKMRCDWAIEILRTEEEPIPPATSVILEDLS